METQLEFRFEDNAINNNDSSKDNRGLQFGIKDLFELMNRIAVASASSKIFGDQITQNIIGLYKTPDFYDYLSSYGIGACVGLYLYSNFYKIYREFKHGRK